MAEALWRRLGLSKWVGSAGKVVLSGPCNCFMLVLRGSQVRFAGMFVVQKSQGQGAKVGRDFFLFRSAPQGLPFGQRQQTVFPVRGHPVQGLKEIRSQKKNSFFCIIATKGLKLFPKMDGCSAASN